MIPSDLQFAHPTLVVLLLFMPFIFLGYMTLIRYQKNGVKQFGEKEVLDKVALLRYYPFSQLKLFFLLLGWLFLVLAMMGPMGNAHYQLSVSEEERTQEVLFLIDVSDSMNVKDSRTGRSRLQHAKALVDDISSLMQGQTMSLYSFTSSLQPIVPPTLDTFFIRLMAENLRLNEGGVPGTDYAEVAADLSEKLQNMPEKVRRTVVMISDGGDTKWEVADGAEKDLRKKEILQAFKNVNGRAITIGVGGTKKAPIPNLKENGIAVESKLEPELLKNISEDLRGAYFVANDAIVSDLAKKVVENIHETEFVMNTLSQKRDVLFDLYYKIPLFAALLFFAAAAFVPETKKRRKV